MRRLKIFEGKPLKRIELKAHSKNSKVRLRASRTGGLNAAYHPVRGITLNTKYGLRASKTFKGLTLGVQGRRTVFRGRWSSKNGLLNANLSRSGLSFSTKSKYGTYNWTRPNYSSFKFAGIQLRGKNASGLAFIFAVITLIPAIIQLAFYSLIFAFQTAVFLLRFSFGAASFLFRLVMFISAVLMRILLLAFNISLFLLWDMPRQLFNLAKGNAYFDLEEEVLIDTENERDRVAAELLELEEGQESLHKEAKKLAAQSAGISDDEAKNVELRIKEIDQDFEGRSSQLLARIAEIDSEIEAMEAESRKLLPDDKASIKAQISNIESDIKKRPIPKTGLMRFLAVLGFLFGAFCVLIPFSILVSFAANPSTFLNGGPSGIAFLILFSGIFGFIGFFACRPGMALLKNYQDTRAINNLERQL
jgi:hypothetical protein